MNQKILAVNLVVQNYFIKHPGESKIPAKDMMLYFVQNRIFSKDHKNGLPIRNLLRDLDKLNQLKAIPFVLAERGNVNTNWFFVRSSKSFVNNQISKPPVVKNESVETSVRKESDESYVIDLCDKVLDQKASRQHKFDFLVGDSGRRLPVDAFYGKLKIAVEYRERQHLEGVNHFDKPHIMTVSGVHRGEQRKIYDQRRREVLPEYGIQLIEIDFSDFNYDSRKSIIRNFESDLSVVKHLLRNNN
ncbi:MAG: hypothetical protein JJE55_14090 [Flavobacteriaceae bacterium]|nr:hypothetical protein [Flavobacteriaceae bacterium]